MKLFTKTLSVFILALVFSTFAFAASNANGKAFFETNNTEIPSFVTDPNFRVWQPPQPVQVIPSYQVNDIAWTNGFVIFYSPQIMSQAPYKIRAFFIAHEYGHIYWQTGNELGADTFAARAYAQTDPSVCQAIVWWMINFPNPGDATHAPSPVRAQNIARTCGV